MGIKNGFKQTEMGIIPEDWSTVKLSEVATFANGKAHEQFIEDYGEFIVINSKFISTGGRIYKRSCRSLSPLNMGDVVMVMSDIPNGKALAKCYVVPENMKFTLNQRICVLRSFGVENKFLYYILNRNKYYLAFDSGTGQTNLKRSEVLECPLAIPPKQEEQKKIASTISDTERLLSTIELLIQKKKNIKQGAMQDLLTGKKRLPEFCKSKWIVTTVGEHISFSGGSQPPFTTFKFKKNPGYIRLIQMRDYKTSKYITYIPEVLAQKKCSAKDVMIGRYGPPIFQIYRGLEGAYNVALVKAIPGKKIDLDFMYYFLKQEKIFLMLDRLSRRSAGQSGVDLPALKEYPLYLPSLDEQKVIATVLADMDNEIYGLKIKLIKYRNIKQGMMQTLLTGEIRLI